MIPARAMLVGGWAHPATCLQPLAEALGPVLSCECVAVHTLCAGCGGRGAVSDYARGLASRVARATGPVLLVGWSMGALVALEAVAAGLCQPAGLVLLSGTARFTAAGGDYPFGHPARNIRALRQAVVTQTAPALEGFFGQVGAPGTPEPADLRGSVDAAMEQGMESLVAGLHYLEQTDLREGLAGIRVPTLLMHGDADLVVPWKAGQFVAESIPGARFILLPGVGHGFVKDCARALASDILSACGMKIQVS